MHPRRAGAVVGMGVVMAVRGGMAVVVTVVAMVVVTVVAMVVVMVVAMVVVTGVVGVVMGTRPGHARNLRTSREFSRPRRTEPGGWACTIR